MKARNLIPLILSGFLTAALPSPGHTGQDVTSRSWMSPLGGLTIPSAWQGIWETTTVLRDCSTHVEISTTTLNDTLCANEPYSPTFECTGSISDASFDITCTGGITVFPGCTANFDIHTTGTRSANSYTATTISNTTYVGACGVPNRCTESTITATRIANGQTECTIPVEPTTWGGIKARYDR